MTAQEQALRQAAKLFHEIVGAITARDMLGRTGENLVAAKLIRAKLRGDLRSPEQLRRIAADGFELCIRALVEMGATDVSIHECSAVDIEEPPL